LEYNYCSTCVVDYAVRYRIRDCFSAGFGVSPVFLYDGIEAIPCYISLRFNVLPSQHLSPYFLLDAGASND
jgi:hypothetical protein